MKDYVWSNIERVFLNFYLKTLYAKLVTRSLRAGTHWTKQNCCKQKYFIQNYIFNTIWNDVTAIHSIKQMIKAQNKKEHLECVKQGLNKNCFVWSKFVLKFFPPKAVLIYPMCLSGNHGKIQGIINAVKKIITKKNQLPK